MYRPLESIKQKESNMSKFVTPGTIAAVLAVLAVMAGAFGMPGLQHFFQDPATAQTIMTLLGAGMALVAGALTGVKPTPPPAA
jgi:hypothetical protein